MIGTVLGGHYRLVRELGRGGQGSVFEAWDENLQRPVAVKLLVAPMGSGGMTAGLRRFDREALATAQLGHPHIVVLHLRGEHDGVPYMVMEYVDGGSLAERLAAAPHGLPADDVVVWGGQTASALEAAHELGLAHRDIKPSNLLLTPRGAAKVCDFGLVTRLRVHDTGITAKGAVLGTPGYFSPEQARGATGDGASDIYSLGLTLYALLAGASPQAAASPNEARLKALGPPPPPVTHWRPEIAPRLASLLATMLEPEPTNRPTAGEVAAALSEPAARREAPRLPPPAAPARAALPADALAREAELLTGAEHGAPEPDPLTAECWPLLEEAERLLESGDPEGAEQLFARLSADLSHRSAQHHAAFLAAVFGRVRATAARGRRITAAKRLARLVPQVHAALPVRHPLRRAVDRFHV